MLNYRVCNDVLTILNDISQPANITLAGSHISRLGDLGGEGEVMWEAIDLVFVEDGPSTEAEQ